jgi:gliding motility-associated-like protein
VIDLTVAAVTTGSDPGTLSYWTDAGATVPLATPSAVSTTGTYFIQLDDGSCSVIQAVNVIVNTAPILIITDPAAVCSPNTVDITASTVTAGSDPGTLTYWTDASAISPLTTSLAVATTGTYYIQLDLGGGCIVIMPVNVTVNLSPTLISFTGSDSYCSGDSISDVFVDVSGTPVWTIDYTLDGVVQSISASVTPISLGNTEGVYVLTTISDGNCSTNVNETQNIVISNCEPIAITVPTAFTPDGDMTNDTWKILDMDANLPNNIVRVYNRWGNLIFEHLSSMTNPYSSNEWDGTYKGEQLPVGSYYYIIEHNDGSSDSETGTVSIILNK